MNPGAVAPDGTFQLPRLHVPVFLIVGRSGCGFRVVLTGLFERYVLFITLFVEMCYACSTLHSFLRPCSITAQ